MPFERFTKTGRGYKPKASIWSSGQIGFNQGAVERFRLNNFKYAIFFYDSEEKKIGFQFTNDENEDGIVKLVKRAGGISFSARAFLDFNDINYSKTTRYDVSYDSENNLYVIELV
jgi:hypothetical protein